jgi:hypothetical protein
VLGKIKTAKAEFSASAELKKCCNARVKKLVVICKDEFPEIEG